MIYILGDKIVDGCVTLSTIAFNYIDIDIDITEYDCIVLTSKNGIKGLEYNHIPWQQLPIYSIGSATSKYVSSSGGNIAYEAKEYYGDEFASELVSMLQYKRVLYPRAKKVVSNLISILKNNGIDIVDKVVYETVCNNNKIELQTNSIFIFSSPSTVECFFDTYEWDDSYIAIAIGTKTAKYIPKNIAYHISDKQTIDGAVEYAKQIYLQSY